MILTSYRQIEDRSQSIERKQSDVYGEEIRLDGWAQAGE